MVEVVSAETVVSVAAVDSPMWEVEGMECLSGRIWEDYSFYKSSAGG